MTNSIMASLNLLPNMVLAWAATFLLHSTLLIACIWLLTRLLGMRGLTVQDKLWKVALIGALFSCTVQAGLGDGTMAPRITLPLVASPADIPVKGNVIPATPAADLSGSQWSTEVLTGRSDPDSARLLHGGAVSGAVGRRLLPLHWQWMCALLWVLGAAGCTGVLARQLVRLKRRFRDRREITSGPLHRIFSELVASRYKRSGVVRLTISHRIPVPVACGIRRPEICLPSSMAQGMAPEQLRSVLAHELAHIVRRDQVWLLAARLVEGIFFFQPLVRLARRCFQETAEFICDGEAVRQTGERIPLARTLHQMALRQISTPTAQTMPGISGKGSPLNRRIEMILDKNRPAAGRARWFGPLAIALVLIFALLAPGVAVGDDPPPRADEVIPVERPPAPDAPAPDMAEVPRVMNVPAPEAPRPGFDGGEPVSAPMVPRAASPADMETAVPDVAVAPRAAEPVAWDEDEVDEAEDAAAAEAEHEMATRDEILDRAEREMAAEAEAMKKVELEMAAQEEAMALAELEMTAEEEAMREAEREMAVQAEVLELAEQEMVEQEKAMALAELEMTVQEEVMREAEREMVLQEESMLEEQREMELVEQEMAEHQLDLARAEQGLAEQEEALACDLEVLDRESAEGASREEVQAREQEIRRRHQEIQVRHREITRQHAEISREHRDAARRQAEARRQRRAVSHAEETAMDAQRRGMERALRGIEQFMDGELSDEYRDQLEAMRSDIEVKLELLDEREAVERIVVPDETVPRPEELE